MVDVVADSGRSSIRLAQGPIATHAQRLDKATHTRFLTYLETWPYFRPPGATRLTGAEFMALDAELQQLEGRLADLDDAARSRREALRVDLMID